MKFPFKKKIKKKKTKNKTKNKTNRNHTNPLHRLYIMRIVYQNYNENPPFNRWAKRKKIKK
jgi:hypothetical protein